MDWKVFEGKKVYLILKGGRRYSGIIISVDDSSRPVWFSLKDKFGNFVSFSNEEVIVLQQEGRE